MTAPRIEQLYCTHCTYGTAALHRAQDARRDQVFEYSTRSGSLDQFRSHQVFQSIEQYVRFQLPGDTPAAEMVRLTAETVPWQRLAFFPAVAGQCVLVRSCYRQRDTRDRPGSYFAHVLLGSATPTPQFSLLDGLRMWGAPMWVSADAPDLPFDLPKLAGLSELSGYGAVINDAALLAFLQTPADANWDIAVSPAVRQVVSKRWRTMDAAKRRKLVSDLLATMLALNIVRGDRLIVAVEPALAALLFYGIVRLMPFRAIVERLSFSTCQSHFENAVATLSAVSFFDPQTADLNPEAYRGAALNTFNQKRGQLIRSHAAADTLVDLFVQRGDTSEIERISRRAESCGAAQLAHFEEILAAHAAVPAWRRPAAEDEPVMPGGKAGRRYLQLSLLEEFAAWGPDSAEWRAVAGAPRHVRRLLELLAGAEGSPAILERLYDLIDDNELRGIVLDPQAPVELKTRLLQRRIERTGQWPWICADLWNGRLPAGVPADLPQQVCGSLPRERFLAVQQWLLDGLSRETPENASDRYRNLLRVLILRCRQNEAERGLLTSAFQPPRYTDELGRAVLRDGHLSAELVTAFPEYTTQLGACAAGVLDQLWSQGRAFREQFQMIRTVQAVLPETHRSRWHAWLGVNDRLQQLAPLYASTPPWYDLLGRRTHRANLSEAGEGLARDADRALSGPEYNGQRGAAGKAETIREIAKYVITENLPADFAERLTSAMRNEGWEPRKAEPPAVDAPAARAVDEAASDSPPAPRRRRRLLRTMVLLLIIAAVGAGFWFGGGVPWARANIVDRLYALLPKIGETPPAPDSKVKETPGSDSKATDPEEAGKPEAEAPKKNGPKADGKAEPVVVTDADPPPKKPEGLSPTEEKPKAEPPKSPAGTTVAVNPMPMPLPVPAPGTPTANHSAAPEDVPRLRYPRQKLGAHLSSVVVTERIPAALVFDKGGPVSPLIGFQPGVENVEVYSPVLDTPEHPRKGEVCLTRTSNGKTLTLSLRHEGSTDVTSLLMIQFDQVPALKRCEVSGVADQHLAAELLATCVLEFRYPDHARYVALVGPPASTHAVGGPKAILSLSEYWNWLGAKPEMAVAPGNLDSPATSGVLWFSPLGKANNIPIPFRLSLQRRGSETKREWQVALSADQQKQIRTEKDRLDRVGRILYDKEIVKKGDEYAPKASHEWHWDDYRRLCQRLDLSPLPPPPAPPKKDPKKKPNGEQTKKWLDDCVVWSQQWNKQILQLRDEQAALVAPLNRELAGFPKEHEDFRCYLAFVYKPKWDLDGRLQSGIVVPTCQVQATD